MFDGEIDGLLIFHEEEVVALTCPVIDPLFQDRRVFRILLFDHTVRVEVIDWLQLVVELIENSLDVFEVVNGHFEPVTIIILPELLEEFLILEKVREQVGVGDLERGDRR
ncbi:hypothetical protein [Natronococcus wangiae]|uniref:hypothetical protein n=1 Tax=Natronococcus wangiae TaxID=3068275 RepID=UPI00273D4619|nr:hypothetical protein [Natronococcus sp. AD5]